MTEEQREDNVEERLSFLILRLILLRLPLPLLIRLILLLLLIILIILVKAKAWIPITQSCKKSPQWLLVLDIRVFEYISCY